MPDTLTTRRAGRVSGLMLLLALALMLLACGDERATAGFGLELDMPAGWTYVSGGVSAVRGEAIRYDAAALQQALAGHASAPLFVLLKHKPPQRGNSPTFGINLERAAATRGQTALALLGARVTEATAQGAFTVSETPSATRLAGMVAAHAELHGKTMSGAQGGVTPRVRLHVLVIDDIALLAVSTDAVAGDDDASREFQHILDSLRLPGVPRAP